MSIKALKDMFAAAAPAGYSCTKATLSYTHEHGREMQIITFYGTSPEDGQFQLASEPMDPNTPLAVAVEQMMAQMPKDPTP